MTIGEKIRSRRIELGITQEELANRLGYRHKSSIGKIENGNQLLTQSKIAAISKALQTTPGWILDWNEDIADTTKNTELIDGFNALNSEEQAMLMNYLSFLLQRHSSQP